MTRYVFRRRWARAAAAALDAAGGILFRPAAPAGLPPRNLLIVRLDHLGDVWNVAGLPKAVKEHFSGCRVTCLVSHAAAPLLEGNPFVDEIIRFDAPWFSRSGRGGRLARLADELRRRKFDAALSIRGDLREHWLVWRAGIGRRIGPGITGGGFFLTDRVPWREEAHESERIAETAERLGLPKKSFPPEIHFTPGERERLRAEAEAKGLRGKWIGFQVEAGSSAKTWPVTHAAHFLSKILRQDGRVKIALLGTDARRAEDVLGRIEMERRSRVIFLSGKLSLRELAANADRFEFLIGPDSGPAHILAFLGVPTLFLYSGTNRFESWKPLAENAVVLRHAVPCSPCGLRRCPIEGHPCMSGIDPDKAAEVVLERLS